MDLKILYWGIICIDYCTFWWSLNVCAWSKSLIPLTLILPLPQGLPRNLDTIFLPKRSDCPLGETGFIYTPSRSVWKETGAPSAHKQPDPSQDPAQRKTQGLVQTLRISRWQPQSQGLSPSERERGVLCACVGRQPWWRLCPATEGGLLSGPHLRPSISRVGLPSLLIRPSSLQLGSD